MGGWSREVSADGRACAVFGGLVDAGQQPHASDIIFSLHENAAKQVGEFRRLAMLAEADGHLRQKLQQASTCSDMFCSALGWDGVCKNVGKG